MVLSTGAINLLPNLNIFELQLSRLWTVKLGRENDKGERVCESQFRGEMQIDL